MLQGRVGIITGAAGGIGLAIATALKNEGLLVVMTDVNEQHLKKEAKQLKSDFFPADLCKRDDCKALVEYTIEKYGRTDILVNVAGVQNVEPIEDFNEERWDFMISLMLTAPFLLTKYVWNSMKMNNWGRIIYLNSIHGQVASAYKVAYVSAKHGLMGLTKTAALEGGPFGITANSICPAYVRTPLLNGQIEAQAHNHGIPKEDVINKTMLHNAVIKKLLEPSDVAESVKFLCSPAANHITGTALTIDGGWTAS